MEIIINEKKTQLKYGFRALMYFEKIMGYTFQGGGLSDVITLMYCCYMAGNDDAITFNNFVEWLDNNPNKLAEFTQYLTNKLAVNEQLAETPKEAPSPTNEDAETAKKK